MQCHKFYRTTMKQVFGFQNMFVFFLIASMCGWGVLKCWRYPTLNLLSLILCLLMSFLFIQPSHWLGSIDKSFVLQNFSACQKPGKTGCVKSAKTFPKGIAFWWLNVFRQCNINYIWIPFFSFTCHCLYFLHICTRTKLFSRNDSYRGWDKLRSFKKV